MTNIQGSIRFATALAALACIMTVAHAQQKPQGLPGNYPGKPIRIIVGSSPGGGTDISARLVINKLAERWGHSFLIENFAGANGVIGTDMVAKAQPDGYTLLVTSNSTVITAALVAKLPYEVRKAFDPVAQFTAQPYVLAVSNSLPVNSVKELLAYARARPGDLNYASSGTGGASHIGMEQLKFIAGLKMEHIPYKGIGPGITDMLGGRIQLLFGSVLAVMPHAKIGKLKALAVGSLKRSALLPDIPAIAEEGLPGFEMIGWYGLMAPAGTARPVISALNRDILQILASAEVVQKLAVDGAEGPQFSPEYFRDKMLEELDKVAKLIKETGIKLE